MGEVGKLATETGAWPLWEAVDGKLTISRMSKKHLDKENRKDPQRYFDLQGRFSGISEELQNKFRTDIDAEEDCIKRFM